MSRTLGLMVFVSLLGLIITDDQQPGDTQYEAARRIVTIHCYEALSSSE